MHSSRQVPSPQRRRVGGLSTPREAQARERLIFVRDNFRRRVRTPQPLMNPARRRTSRRAANRRTSATASNNRGGRNGIRPAPPDATILPSERGILPPSLFLQLQSGNIMVHHVAVTEGINSQRPSLKRRGASQLYDEHPQSGQTIVLTSAFPAQGACPASSVRRAQQQLGFAGQLLGSGSPQPVNTTATQPRNIVLPQPPNASLLQPSGFFLPQLVCATLQQPPKAVSLQPSNTVSPQPPSVMSQCPVVPEVSHEEIALEYVNEKLEEELRNQMASFDGGNASRKKKLDMYNRILLLQKILAM
ncbi:uncharacterized protein LOC142800920 isoform X2 [Rhipicephalus microplus]|uniref:uncharacterized protein LOC142800920 isoform X2 n=1 Tax=Rhipicephalus microplus TaxID=6941 RepID=UPI003F6BBCE5